MNKRVAVHIQDPVGLSSLVETVTLSAPGCRCGLHDAAKSDTVLQDVESVRPFKAGCVIFQGSARPRGVGWSRSPDAYTHTKVLRSIE